MKPKYYSRHSLSRNPNGAAEKFEIVNVPDCEKSKKKKKKNVIYINLTCNTVKGKIEAKGTLLGEKSKIAWSVRIYSCEIKEFHGCVNCENFS